MALGVDKSTPRDGTTRVPFQRDATRFRGKTKDTVGKTLAAGFNDVEQGTARILAEIGGKLPQVTPGGSLNMTLHQVNRDGAGPYTCMINVDGTAQSWKNIKVTQNVAGDEFGRNQAGIKSDHPLAVAIPANQNCIATIAGQKNVCLVRCQNPATAGPFGGVVPVQMASDGGSGAPANNGTVGDGDGDGNGGNNTGKGYANKGNTGNTGNNNSTTGTDNVKVLDKCIVNFTA